MLKQREQQEVCEINFKKIIRNKIKDQSDNELILCNQLCSTNEQTLTKRTSSKTANK